MQVPGGGELAEDAAPDRLGVMRPAAEDLAEMVVELDNLFGPGAREHVDDMGGAEALAGLHHGGEREACIVGRLDQGDGIETGVAIAAGPRALAEIGKQRHPAAARRLAKPDQGVEPLMRAPLVVVAAVIAVDEHPAHADVVEPVEHARLAGGSVAGRAADLLVIGLDPRRDVGVEDVADIGLVDAHAEGDGRDDHHPRLGDEDVLVSVAVLRGHPGMVGERAEPFAFQQRRGLLDLAARQAVDDAALPAALLDEGEKLAPCRVSRLHGEPDIGPVETGDELRGVGRQQPGRDVLARHLVRRRGQRQYRHVGEPRAEGGERRVFRPEGRAPLRNAVRLVDGKQRNRQA